MSSAILYLAIVAIWACVLIPRWLRRDSARGTAVPGDAVPGEVVSGDTGSGTATAVPAVPAEEPRPVTARAGDEADERWEEDAGEPAAPDGDVPPRLTAEESRQRMLAARRRLLGMLLLLEIAAIALAVLGLAALWVVIPPTVMLTGYLLLLREAAHADAEHAARDRGAAEARAARARARERARARQRTASRTAVPATAAPPAAPAAGYEDSGPGRDFAPGLAGKYTTSNAEIIDISGRTESGQYQEKKLRAVGD